MKKGLMTQFPFSRGRAFVCKNIGDYIQAVATRQFVEPIDEYIEQEEANNYFPKDGKKILLIMNGWFQWRAENFPPSKYIQPLLISMHISPLKAKELLTPEGINFFKNHEPVGCRDLYTKNLLESHGISSYFSACMTLTLGKNYSVPEDSRKGFYFVDPYFEIPELKNIKIILSLLNFYVKNFFVIYKLSRKSFFKDYLPTGFLDRNHKFFRRFYKAGVFYKIYSKKFDKNFLLNAEYITHWIDVDMSGKINNDDLLDMAENLIKKYASSKMVVTSRIHAGLPSLGLNTPVIFIANEEVISENGTFNTPGRLGGLLDFFRILNLEKNGIFTTNDQVFSKIKKFNFKTKFKNKTEWKVYADKLSEACIKFINK